jgi:hypothetical protein
MGTKYPAFNLFLFRILILNLKITRIHYTIATPLIRYFIHVAICRCFPFRLSHRFAFSYHARM